MILSDAKDALKALGWTVTPGAGVYRLVDPDGEITEAMAPAALVALAESIAPSPPRWIPPPPNVAFVPAPEVIPAPTQDQREDPPLEQPPRAPAPRKIGLKATFSKMPLGTDAHGIPQIALTFVAAGEGLLDQLDIGGLASMLGRTVLLTLFDNQLRLETDAKPGLSVLSGGRQ